MNKALVKFLLFVFSVFLFLFEMIEMFPASENTSFSSRFIIAVSTLLFISVLVLYGNTDRNIKRDGHLLFYAASIVGIYVSSLLCGGIISAFQANTQYLVVILPVLVLWNIRSRSVLNYDFLMKCICLIFIGLSLYFFSNYSLHVLLKTQDNGAYTLLYFLPFVLCIRKGYFRFGGIVIIFVALLLSLKRGGLLAFALAAIVYMIINTVSYSGKKIGFWHIIVSVIVVVGLIFLYVYFDQMTGNILTARFQSIQDDGGSGRLDIFTVVWNHIKNASFINIVFGHGWDAVRMQCGLDISAHNDFLEILYDFGIIVFALYILFYIKLYKFVRRLIKRRSFYAAPYGAAFILLAVNSTVSHIIFYPKYAILFALFFGLMSVPINKEKR